MINDLAKVIYLKEQSWIPAESKVTLADYIKEAAKLGFLSWQPVRVVARETSPRASQGRSQQCVSFFLLFQAVQGVLSIF